MNNTFFKKLYLWDIAELSTKDLFLYKAQIVAQGWCKNVRNMFNINNSLKFLLKCWFHFLFTPLVPLTLGITLIGARKNVIKSAGYVLKEPCGEVCEGSLGEGWSHSNERVWWIAKEKFTRSVKEL